MAAINQSTRRRQVPRKRHSKWSVPAFISLLVVMYALFVLYTSFATKITLDEKPRSNIPTMRIRESKPVGREQLRGSSQQEIHILFSTSCSSSQDWQSYLFFHSMMHVQQTGNVTRLISGCTPEERAHQEEQMQQIQTTMSPRFHAYFTELDFGKKFSLKQGDWHSFKYFNKPFSVLAYMQDALGFAHGSVEHENDLIVLMDPDMIALQSFVNDFSEFVPETQAIKKVSHGHMFGQPFGYGKKWYEEAKENISYLVGTENSPVASLSGQDLYQYHAGPPYIGTGRDFYSLVQTWCDILPRYQELRSHFMVEMYSASLAAAHLGLPFHLVPDFMISDDKVQNEGWSGIDSADPNDLCDVEKIQHLPLVHHYCQRFGLGEFFFNKHVFNTGFFDCQQPLLRDPPRNVALLYNYSHYGDGTNKTWVNREYKFVKRNAFMLCSMTSALNEASTFYKQQHCDQDANYDKTWMWHDAKAKKEIGHRRR